MTDGELKALTEKLKNTVGSRIDKICTSSLGEDFSKNQCAHYVSHVLGYDFSKSASCKFLTFKDSQDDDVEGATIRVDVIFNKLSSPQKQKIRDQMCYPPGLIFVTQERNIQRDGKMGNLPAKHIGVLAWPWVYHYSNTENKVKKDNITQFMSVFRQAYAGNGDVVFYRGNFIR